MKIEVIVDDDDLAAGLQNAAHLARGGDRIGKVFENQTGHHEIESVVLEGNAEDRPFKHAMSVGAELRQFFLAPGDEERVDLDTGCMQRRKLGQHLLDEVARTAAAFQNSHAVGKAELLQASQFLRPEVVHLRAQPLHFVVSVGGDLMNVVGGAFGGEGHRFTWQK